MVTSCFKTGRNFVVLVTSNLSMRIFDLQHISGFDNSLLLPYFSITLVIEHLIFVLLVILHILVFFKFTTLSLTRVTEIYKRV